MPVGCRSHVCGRGGATGQTAPGGWLASTAGITDFGIVVGDTAPEVMAAVGDGSRWGIRVTYLRQDAPRGLAHAVAIAQGFMAGGAFVMFEGWWKDTGKPEDVLEANRLLLDTIEPRLEGEVEGSEISGRVRIGAGTRVVRSVVRGPVVIGEGCEIENAYIGPFTSIGDRCRVRGSEVENSVILEGCVIDRVGVRIDGSLLGRGVVLERAPARPRAISLVLGDQSRARIV